jgi:hypothetical protein
MGMNAKFIITGDPSQVDLPPKMHSGLKEAMRNLKKCTRNWFCTPYRRRCSETPSGKKDYFGLQCRGKKTARRVVIHLFTMSYGYCCYLT